MFDKYTSRIDTHSSVNRLSSGLLNGNNCSIINSCCVEKLSHFEYRMLMLACNIDRYALCTCG